MYMTKLQVIDLLKLHIKNIDNELCNTTEITYKVELLKEKGESVRKLAELVSE